ncbi:MAG TPA: DNA-processing protein DprA [bacterium]
MDDLKYWLAFNEITGLGPVRIARLLEAFKSPAEVFSSGRDELICMGGLSRLLAEMIKKFNDWAKIEREIKFLDKHNFGVVTRAQREYPEMIKTIYDPPVIFYTAGNVEYLNTKCIAMVGSREPTPYGREVARMLAKDLCGAGLTIVSGFAAGIDSEAHSATLEAGGRTIAVFGCGIDIVYPKFNKTLYKQVCSGGLAVSEFSPGVKPLRENFPKRNRIISGLSLGVVVIEAGIDSGSLITAESAIEQGREIFAIPGRVTSEKNSGCHKLIKSGAKLVENADDILEELGTFRKNLPKKKVQIELKMDPDEKNVVETLKGGKKQIDIIIRESNLPSSSVTSILTKLEIEGVVTQHAGKIFELRCT